MFKRISVIVGIALAAAFMVAASSQTSADAEIVSTVLYVEIQEQMPIKIKASEEEKEEPVKYYTDKDAIDIAKVLYAECRGIESKTEQACVAWTILNRVDLYESSVYSVVREENQYAFYESSPVEDNLLSLSYDVLERWNREKNGEDDVGRVLPKDYTFFSARNNRNYFRNKFNGSYDIWKFSCDSPYEN